MVSEGDTEEVHARQAHTIECAMISYRAGKEYCYQAHICSMDRVQKPLEVHGQDLSDFAFGNDVLDLKSHGISQYYQLRGLSQETVCVAPFRVPG
jgi:hypothetical protein